ncbi:putative immunoglobulin-blocking virulence protein [[Mycoplasma] phocae]|uniref:Putative immunoglobulin-blocking virulence protein n=1 Tax=[Mycoplasma] phocae TaxID=142651 RepID=A0A2Z5IPE0_9BACT|nr:putative immunoglobulin-blocking virulence protein [[Mycoplasma] phocae]AXE60529.1 putative immunoglobulin-blocking virulence protein [[Mycoplasma] phocae]
MGFIKKRKNKILLGVFATVIATSITVGTGLYFLNSDSRNKFISVASASVNPNLINNNNLDIRNANSSSVDQNLKENNKKEEQKENKKVEKPDKNIEIKNEDKNKKDENKRNNDIASDSEKIVEEYIDFNGLKVKVRIKKIIRNIDPKYKHLANRDPYINNTLGKLVSVEVTDELRELNKNNVQNSFKNKIPENVLSELANSTESQNKAYIRQNTFYFENLFDKYRRLFDAPNDKVKQFLTAHGKSIYDVEIKGHYEKTIAELNNKIAEIEKKLSEHENKFKGNDDPGFDEYSKEFQRIYNEKKELENQKIDAKNHKYVQLIKNLDYTKFNVSSQIQQNLSKGLVIDQKEQNVYVNENGELESYATSPLLNEVVARNSRDNAQKRVFGIPGPFGRTPDSIAEGNYEGWIKNDVTTSPEFNFLNIKSGEGIKIEQLTKDPNSKVETKIKSGYVVTIDASNPVAYNKTLKVIQDLIANKKEITSYRIKNIGLTNKNQEFFEIFKALPEHLPQLELFFESTNTSALLALESKKIDELSIYTTGNSLLDDWVLNPYAFLGVAWYNNLDYNVSKDFQRNIKITTRVTFNSIGFEESDYKPDLKRINDGLKIAYWIRNNEPLYQGSLGPGLDPDTNERGNSYPTGLDLTRVTSMKSLRGLEFKKEPTDPENTRRRLRRIGLYNDSSVFTIDADELNEAQFDILDTNPDLKPKSKIFFSNGFETRRIKVTNLKNTQLTSTGRTNLNILLNFSEDNFSRDTEIEIDTNDTNLVNSLTGFKISQDKIEIA